MGPGTLCRQMAAALLWALLLFANPAHAQTISNTAKASWTQGGFSRSAASNTVDVAVSQPTYSLETFKPSAGSSPLPVRASLCGGSGLQIFPASAGSRSSVESLPTSELRASEVLVIRFAASVANRDASALDQVALTLTTPGGDREELRLFETDVNTGIFTGAIRTRAIPPAIAQRDCVLSVRSGEQITVTANGTDGGTPLVSVLVAVLADPFGYVFDSDDGTPVSGARVTLVDAVTGQPARVFADDGVTPWPSSVTTGDVVVDAAGNRYQLARGEYRFPLAPLGGYRIAVEPPPPYTAPSSLQPPDLAGLTRPEGGPYAISDASYGNAFTLGTAAPIRVDIPVDRPSAGVTLTKSASRARVQPGDAVFYTLIVRNPDPARGEGA